MASSMRETTLLKGRTVLPRTTVPQDLVARELREKFSRIVGKFPVKTVAAAAGDVVDKTVMHWRKERSLPDLESTLNMARPSGAFNENVWQFICEHAGRDPSGDPRVRHAYALLQTIGNTEGPQAEWARSLLRKAGGDE